MGRNIFCLECTNPDCKFRTTVSVLKDQLGCPICSAPMKFEKIEIDGSTHQAHHQVKPAGWTVVLDNIRSVLNVGSIFRTADAVGVEKIYCCGITPTPDHPKLAKTSLGAEWSVKWEYSRNAVVITRQLIADGYRISCLEETSKSTSIFECSSNNLDKNVLVVGNEITGVDFAIIQMSHNVFDLPMQGFKRSLNVAVAFGIAIYQLVYRSK